MFKNIMKEKIHEILIRKIKHKKDLESLIIKKKNIVFSAGALIFATMGFIGGFFFNHSIAGALLSFSTFVVLFSIIESKKVLKQEKEEIKLNKEIESIFKNEETQFALIYELSLYKSKLTEEAYKEQLKKLKDLFIDLEKKKAKVINESIINSIVYIFENLTHLIEHKEKEEHIQENYLTFLKKYSILESEKEIEKNSLRNLL